MSKWFSVRFEPLEIFVFAACPCRKKGRSIYFVKILRDFVLVGTFDLVLIHGIDGNKAGNFCNN